MDLNLQELMEYAPTIIGVVFWICIIALIFSGGKKMKKNRPGSTPPLDEGIPDMRTASPFDGKAAKQNGKRQQTIASDGYRVPKDMDITCTGRDGHRHPGADMPRYIVHEQPDNGYVVLNGVKRKLSDCKYL